LLLLATDYHGFTQGFFRWDDFSFIQDAGNAIATPIAQHVSQRSLHAIVSGCGWQACSHGSGPPHRRLNSHGCSISRTTYLPSCAAGRCALLAACSVRRITAVCFCLFAWFWPGWGRIHHRFLHPHRLTRKRSSAASWRSPCCCIISKPGRRAGCWLASSAPCWPATGHIGSVGLSAIGGFVWAGAVGGPGPRAGLCPGSTGVRHRGVLSSRVVQAPLCRP